ncbi:hypothetical protein HDK90DRAFT_515756 [Phyllosticta capitalensis]|uniref:Uncharacterized protein n=1 Tax=Phyllosticta capitalensis TaxID=121624 RepID=A0ABR1Y9N2_9PEZI
MPGKGHSFHREAMAGVHSKPKQEIRRVASNVSAAKSTSRVMQGVRAGPSDAIPKIIVTPVETTDIERYDVQKRSHDNEESVNHDGNNGGVHTQAKVEPHSRNNMISLDELQEISQEIKSLKKSQAALEAANKEWRHAFAALEEENIELLDASNKASDKHLITTSQLKGEIDFLRARVNKLEQQLGTSKLDTRDANHQLSKSKDQRLEMEKTLKKKVHELEAKLSNAYKSVSALKSDLGERLEMEKTFKKKVHELEAKLSNAYRSISGLKSDHGIALHKNAELVSAAADLNEAIRSLENVPSTVVRAMNKFSDKVFRPWKLHKSKG